MDRMKRQFSWLGAVLILLGGLLLMRRLHVFDIRMAQIIFGFMIIWGIVLVGRGFSAIANGKVFWGTALFLFGVYFFIRDIDFLDISYRLIIPATFLIFGTAFLMMWLNNVREWQVLIPAFLIGGAGVAFLMSEFGYLSYWDVWETLHRYWPIAIILLGIGIMFRKSRQHLPPPMPPNPPMDQPVNQAG